jgi:hypothetical protein
MPQSASATVQIGTYNPLTDAFTSVLDLNDFTNIAQLDGSPEIEQPELVFQRASNPRADGERITNKMYKNRHINLKMTFGKAANYIAIRNLISTFVALVESAPFVLRYAPPSPAVNVNYSYFDVLAVTHDADKFNSKRIINGQARVNAIFECAPYIRGDRQWLQNLASNPGHELPAGGGNATTMPVVFNDNFANVNAYNTEVGSAPTVSANVMTIVSGARVSFGSPAWGALYQWQVRFKWVTGLTANFFLHLTDASNYLYVPVSSGANAFGITHTIAGVAHALTSASPTLTNGNFYWLRVTQFPAATGGAPMITANLFNDSAGSIGSAVTNGSLGPVATFDGVTALVGKSQIGAAGASLAIGGAFSNVHTMTLFGPGAWQFDGSGAAGRASGSWDGTRTELGMSGTATIGTQTYDAGPVTSFGSMRIDAAPAGALSASWFLYGGGAAAGTSAMPIKTYTDTFGMNCRVKSSGLGSGATINLTVRVYDASGSFLGSAVLTTLTGNQASWTLLGATWTSSNASAAYFDILINLADATTGSVNGILWIDNVQVYNQTETGAASMPYCELRFPNSPCQLLVSGLLGDTPSPAAYYLGTYASAALPSGATLPFYIGWRARAGATARLVGVNGTNVTTLDNSAYGGWLNAANIIGSLGGFPSNLGVSDLFGTYRPLLRVKTSQSSGNLPSTTAQAVSAWTTTGAVAGQANGKLITPAYSAASAFQVTDGGLISMPPFPSTVAHDLTTMTGNIFVDMEDPNIGGNTVTWNYLALLPADENGSLVIGTITWPATFGAATIVQLAIDGLNAQYQRSDIDITALMSLSTTYTAQLYPRRATLGAGIAGVLAAGGKFGVILGQDSAPQLDPTVKVGVNSGINQGVGLLTDATATVYPFALDILYTPLYLYPRS